ncbi:MAG TPA: sodium-independent anion transporter, partial [Acidimicrobiia bacterium]|nr:sodium-independent anion transporter [Acidimicrobiia bacterium]
FGVIKHSPAQGLVGLATFALVLLLAPRIDHAVLIGIGMGIIVHLVREMRVDLEARIIETTLRLRPGGVLYFASVQTLNEEFTRQLQGHPEAERLEIDLSGAGRLDYTSAVVLKQLADDAGAAGLEVRLVNVPYAARRIVDAVWGK